MRNPDVKDLRPVADEMLAGLHADEAMRFRVLRAARQGKRERLPALRYAMPALACCAALAFAVTGLTRDRLAAIGTEEPKTTPTPVQIDTIAAGHDAQVGQQGAEMMRGMRLSESAEMVDAVLDAECDEALPLTAVGGAVYRMTAQETPLDESMLGESVGEIREVVAEPALASPEAFDAGLSNVAGVGEGIRAIAGVSARTAVAVQVEGVWQAFQRTAYAGRGPGGEGLEDILDIRGKVREMTLSGVGTLTGEAANAAAQTLLDGAVLLSSDGADGRDTLTVTLDSGLRLEMGVSGDTITGCGIWSCPGFFEAFENVK